MELFVEAVKSEDLVKAKKAFGQIMSEKTKDLIEKRKVQIAESVMIESEEDEGDDDDRTDKERKVDDANKNDGESIDSKVGSEEDTKEA